MAVRRYRRKRMPSGTSQPLSLTVVPNNPLAAQTAEMNSALAMANARNGLEKLAQGHTEWFVNDFLPQMLRDDPENRDYWQSLGDTARERIEDDRLSQEVQAGTKTLEDVVARINQRITSVGRDSPQYPALLEQLNTVTDSIAARNFNREMYAAQEKLAKDGDRAAYLATLEGMQSRARDPMAAAAVASQVAELQKEIDDVKKVKRNSEVNGKVIQYLEKKIGRGEIIAFLRERAESGEFDPNESAYLVNLAQEIDSRERTLEREGASSAAGSSTKALQEALDPAKHAYEMADAEFKAAFRDGKADKGIYDDFVKEAEHYQSVLRDALPNAANRTIREQILNAQESIVANLGERRKQMVALIGGDVTADVADLNSKADRAAAKKTPEGDDLAAQMRFLATNLIQTALSDPLIAAMGDNDPTKKALETALRETNEKHQAAIEDQALVVAGKGGEAPLRSAYKKAFGEYEDFMTKKTAADSRVQKSVPLDYESFIDAIDELQETGDTAKFMGQIGLSVVPGQTQKEIDAATEAQLKLENQVGSWQTNVRQASRAQQEIRVAAELRLKELVAPRSQATGRKVADSGPITEPTDVTSYLQHYGAPPALYAGSASGIAPQEMETYAGAGLVQRPSETPVSRPPGMPMLAMPQQEENEDPYDHAERIAWEYLEKPTYTLDLTPWDVPPLPPGPTFEALDLDVPLSDMPLDTHERTRKALAPTSPSPIGMGSTSGATAGPNLAA